MHTLRLLWAAHNEQIWLRRQRRNVSRRCLEQLSEMPDLLFRERFRLTKATFEQLCQDLRSNTSLRGTREIPLEVKVLCTLSFLATGSYQRIVGVTQHLPQRTTSRCIRQVVNALNTEFPLEVKVLCTLSFLATGSYQRIVGVTQHLPQRTTSRCIRQVVNALNTEYIIGKWIVFPQTQQARSRIRQEFQRTFHMPGVIGCIDCTHIAIVKPDDDEHLFYNRKGYHSLNVQMICDHNLKILNVNAKFGGATHDSFIWASSQVEEYMRGLHQNGEQTWLLGDSGYPQRAWLMTPVLNAVPGSREETYTTRHIQARNCIERCFGLLKARWRCLLKHRTLHYHPHVASKIVHACCVLHNIALHASIPPPIDVEEQQGDDDENVGLQAGSSVSSSQDDLVRGRAMLSGVINRM